MAIDGKAEELDVLVAAILTLPVIEPGAKAPERIERFADTLRQLRKIGGVSKLLVLSD